MSKTYITTGATTQCQSGAVSKVIVQVNASLTGSITVIDGITGTTGNVAVITNPGVGSQFEYWDFSAGVRIVTSTICDICVNCNSSYGAK